MKPARVILRSGMAFVCFILGSLAQAAHDADWVDSQRKQWNVPGVAVAVVQVNKPTRLYASGYCNIEHKRRCTTHSPFYIASLTKFFTGLLSATLATEGRLSLDQPIITVWPEFRLGDDRWQQVTLSDVLSQRSGIGSIEWPFMWDPSLTKRDYLDRIALLPLPTTFRQQMNYSNANYVIAGAVIEHALDQTWKQLLQKRILSPLKMNNTRLEPATTMSVGYDLDQSGNLVAVPAISDVATEPAGGIISTASDFSHWLYAVLNNGLWRNKQVIPAAAIQTATTVQIKTGHDRRFFDSSVNAPSGYGFGVFAANYRQQPILFHEGGHAGFRSYFALLPGKQLGVAVFCNCSDNLFTNALALALLDRQQGLSGDELMQRLFATRESPVTPLARIIPPRPLHEYEGIYRNPTWGTFTVLNTGNKLKIRFSTLNADLDCTTNGFSFLSAPGWEILRLRFTEDKQVITGFMLNDATNPEEQWFQRQPDFVH